MLDPSLPISNDLPKKANIPFIVIINDSHPLFVLNTFMLHFTYSSSTYLMIVASTNDSSDNQCIPGNHLFSTIHCDKYKNNISYISLSNTIFLATNNHHSYCKASIPNYYKISKQRRSIYNSTIQIFYVLSMFLVATSQNELGRRTVWRLGISTNDRISHSSYFLMLHEPLYKSCNSSTEVTRVLEGLCLG